MIVVKNAQMPAIQHVAYHAPAVAQGVLHHQLAHLVPIHVVEGAPHRV